VDRECEWLCTRPGEPEFESFDLALESIAGCGGARVTMRSREELAKVHGNGAPEKGTGEDGITEGCTDGGKGEGGWEEASGWRCAR